MTMIVDADSSGTFVVNCVMNRLRPAGAVRSDGLWMRISANRNWFQLHMKYSSASDDKAGRAVGKSTRQNVVQLLAPSTSAASITERGSVAKCERIHSVPKG